MSRQDSGERDRFASTDRDRGRGGGRGYGQNRNSRARSAQMPNAPLPKDVPNRSSEGKSGLVALQPKQPSAALPSHLDARPSQAQGGQQAGPPRPAWGGIKPGEAVQTAVAQPLKQEFPGLGEAPPPVSTASPCDRASLPNGDAASESSRALDSDRLLPRHSQEIEQQRMGSRGSVDAYQGGSPRQNFRGQGGQDRRANRGPGRREQSDGSGGGFTGHNADSESSWRRSEQPSSEQGQGRRDQGGRTNRRRGSDNRQGGNYGRGIRGPQPQASQQPQLPAAAPGAQSQDSASPPQPASQELQPPPAHLPQQDQESQLPTAVAAQQGPQSSAPDEPGPGREPALPRPSAWAKPSPKVMQPAEWPSRGSSSASQQAPSGRRSAQVITTRPQKAAEPQKPADSTTPQQPPLPEVPASTGLEAAPLQPEAAQLQQPQGEPEAEQPGVGQPSAPGNTASSPPPPEDIPPAQAPEQPLLAHSKSEQSITPSQPGPAQRQGQGPSHGQQLGRGLANLTQPLLRPPYPSSLPQQAAYPQHRPPGAEAMAAGHGRGYAARQPPPAVAGPEQLQFGQMEPASGPYQAQVPLTLDTAAAKGLESYMQTGYMPAQPQLQFPPPPLPRPPAFFYPNQQPIPVVPVLGAAHPQFRPIPSEGFPRPLVPAPQQPVPQAWGAPPRLPTWHTRPPMPAQSAHRPPQDAKHAPAPAQQAPGSASQPERPVAPPLAAGSGPDRAPAPVPAAPQPSNPAPPPAPNAQGPPPARTAWGRPGQSTVSRPRASATGQPNHSSISTAERSYSSASSQEPEARQSHLPQPDRRPAETPGAQAAATAAQAHPPVADTAPADGRQPSKEPQTQSEDAVTDAPATPEAQAEPARIQASEASAALRAVEEAGPREEAAAVKPAAAWGAAPSGGAWGQKKSFAQVLTADAGGRASLAASRKAPPARPLAQEPYRQAAGQSRLRGDSRGPQGARSQAHAPHSSQQPPAQRAAAPVRQQHHQKQPNSPTVTRPRTEAVTPPASSPGSSEAGPAEPPAANGISSAPSSEVATPVASSAPWPETVEELERVVTAQEGGGPSGAAASSAELPPEPAAASSAETQQQEEPAATDVLQKAEVTEVPPAPTVGSGTPADPTVSVAETGSAPSSAAQTAPQQEEDFPARELPEEVTSVLRGLVQDYAQAVLASHLRLQPRGLVNTGNLCFMNSILQALMASSPFCKFLQSLQTARPALGSPRQVPTLQALSQLAAAFEPADPEASGAPADPALAEAGSVSSPTKAAAKAGVSNGAAQIGPGALGKQASQTLALLGGKALLPEMMFPTVNRFNPRNVPVNPALAQPISLAERLKGRRAAQREQEDAQEFLGYLLDTAHEELLRLKAAYANLLNLQASASGPAGEDGGGWVKQKRGNKKAITQETGVKGVGTVIQDLCGGQYVSQVKAAGAPQSDTTQPFTLLTLDILPASVQTISGAISRFTEVNTLEDYKLKKDGPKVQATQRVLFLNLPRLLIMHLSRFTYDVSTGNSKVHKRVHFDAKLSMKPAWLAAECPQKRSSPEYDLIATVTHLGTNSTSGHYIANVRQPNGKWLCFDDSNVTMIPLSKVLDEAAYLLIYQLTAPLE